MPLAGKASVNDDAPPLPRRHSSIGNPVLVGLGVILALLGSQAASAQAPLYDLVLRNARIVDGTGKSAYRGDVAIRSDTIARIAPSIPEPATRVIDVGGQVLAPCFIDVHTHAWRGIFEVPTADNFARQGVTTVIEGPDGGSPVPLAPFLPA